MQKSPRENTRRDKYLTAPIQLGKITHKAISLCNYIFFAAFRQNSYLYLPAAITCASASHTSRVSRVLRQ